MHLKHSVLTNVNVNIRSSGVLTPRIRLVNDADRIEGPDVGCAVNDERERTQSGAKIT